MQSLISELIVVLIKIFSFLYKNLRMNNLNFFFKYSPFLHVLFSIILFFIHSFACYSQHQEKDSLLKLIHEKENKPRFTGRDTTYINLLIKLGSHYRFSSSDTLHKISRKVLDHSMAAGYEKGVGKSYIGLSSFFSEKGKDSIVFSHLGKAEIIAKRTKDTLLLLEISNYRAIEYDHIGDSAKSLEEYLKSEKLASKLKNKIFLLYIYENIAATYSNKKLYHRALMYFNKAIAVAKEINDNTILGTILCNVTNAHIGLNNLEKANKSIDKGITIVEKYKLNEWIGYAYMLKGDIFLKKKEYDKALVWYKKSKPIQLSVNYDIGVMDLYNSMSKVYIQKKDMLLGKEYAIKACNLATKIRYPIGIAKSAENLSLVYESENDQASALKYHRLFKKMSDSLSKNEQVIAMAFLYLESTYKEEQLDLISLNKKKLHKQKQLLYITLASLLGLCTIAFLVIKNLNTEKKMSTTLKVKNDILAANEKTLKTINATKDKLFSIIGHDLRGPILSLKELLNLSLADASIFQRFIPKLKTEVEHIQFTLDNLLSWGQTQMKGATIKPKEVNVREIYQNNINLFLKSIEKKKIDIRLLTEENISILTDRDHIDLIARNLISNAIKFTPEKGNIDISSIIEGDIVVCSVKNSGVGIKQENLDKLFNETFHYSTYGTLNEKGTGLGLSLCKEMVELNNGRIWVTSVENINTIFSFSLPLFKQKDIV